MILPFLFFRFPLAIFKYFLHEIRKHWPSSHYDTRRERESANTVQLSPNTWKCWKNISSAPCVSITPPLSIRLRELLESFILHTWPGKKKLSFHREIYNCLVVCLAFSFFNMRAVQCASAACIIRFFFFVQFPRALVVMLFTSC